MAESKINLVPLNSSNESTMDSGGRTNTTSSQAVVNVTPSMTAYSYMPSSCGPILSCHKELMSQFNQRYGSKRPAKTHLLHSKKQKISKTSDELRNAEEENSGCKSKVTVQPEVTLPKISEVTPQQPDEETEGASITEDDDSNVDNDILDVAMEQKKLMLAMEQNVTFLFFVNRESVLSDALLEINEQSFNVNSRIEVYFIGEGCIDPGGWTRDFFILIKRDILKTYVIDGVFQHNILAVQDRTFYRLGQLVGIGFIQSGTAFRIFSKPVYDYICGVELQDIAFDISDISDNVAKQVINKILECKTDGDLAEVITTNVRFLNDCGFRPRNLLSPVTLGDRECLIRVIALHHILMKAKAEMDQFIDGLDSCGGLAKVISRNRQLLSTAFIVGTAVDTSVNSLKTKW